MAGFASRNCRTTTARKPAAAKLSSRAHGRRAKRPASQGTGSKSGSTVRRVCPSLNLVPSAFWTVSQPHYDVLYGYILRKLKILLGKIPLLSCHMLYSTDN
jgi:hypothetical protein